MKIKSLYEIHVEGKNLVQIKEHYSTLSVETKTALKKDIENLLETMMEFRLEGYSKYEFLLKEMSEWD
jgi:Txe/YoeB family toxin of Txe-Axe toxin-antitoxin module